MSWRKLTANVISYSAAISSCAKGQKWQHAVALFAGMVQAQLVPDVVTWV